MRPSFKSSLAPRRAFKSSPVMFAVCVMSSPLFANAATCEWSQRFASDVASHGARAKDSTNDLEAKWLARDARLPAVNGADEAKACGCTAAIPSFEEAAMQAMYADRATSLTAAKQYGHRIKAAADKALDALRRCAGS